MRFLLLFVGVLSAQDFQAILARRCLGCHNERLRTSGLSLESKESIRAGGNRGPASDRLVGAIQHSGELKMPPSGKLPDGEIAVLSKWIESGFAGLPDSGPAKPKSVHWAFVKPKRAGGSIDSFIEEKLRANGLTPAPEADKTTLLRRLHLDLTGLPPITKRT